MRLPRENGGKAPGAKIDVEDDEEDGRRLSRRGREIL
jgi:hypothetical protein